MSSFVLHFEVGRLIVLAGGPQMPHSIEIYTDRETADSLIEELRAGQDADEANASFVKMYRSLGQNAIAKGWTLFAHVNAPFAWRKQLPGKWLFAALVPLEQALEEGRDPSEAVYGEIRLERREDKVTELYYEAKREFAVRPLHKLVTHIETFLIQKGVLEPRQLKK
jgi:hypothetical protein